MSRARREVVKVGDSLAIDFANTMPSGEERGALRSWGDLIDFLELRGALSRGAAADLRAMGERDARRCAEAFARSQRLRESIRAMLGAMAAGRSLLAPWIAEINEALAWGAGADRLVRQGRDWRLAVSPDRADPLRALAPIARSIADLVVRGRSTEIRRCANPRCLLYFRDRSRSRRRRWCSMAVCGNRMKVAAHLRRHGRRPARGGARLPLDRPVPGRQGMV
jgi:predicted RNA-binding Zn ribbon-like protein